jgi:HD-GYP domain-containing protein (c-di-GMP phosphodiesterase class II)
MSEGKTYKLIDKAFITQDATILFDIYEVDESEKKLSMFIPKDTMINGDHKVMIGSFRALYVPAEQREDYDNYCALHLRTIASDEHISFDVKSTALYKKAEKVMAGLFHDPEALGNAELAQEIVSDMMHTVLDNDFTVTSMMKIAAHDYYTHTHSINVSIYALSLGKFLGLTNDVLKDLGESAVLHDLGKSKVNTNIINKNGKLNVEEFDEMKHHPAWGEEIAKKIGLTDKRILSGIRHHHEKMNGGGYPDGLKEDKISLFARIIGVCDVFDALTTKRSYKDPMTSFNALKLINNQMQGHLDMKMVDSLARMLVG